MENNNKLLSNINKIYFYQFLTGMHFMSAVLVPFFTDWAHISFAQIMILQSFFVICVFLLEVPTGAIADHLGRKTSIIMSCIFLTIAPIVYGSFANFYIFMLAEFLFALGVALSSGADEAIVYDSLKESGKEHESKKVLTKFNSWHMAGIMIAAPIGSIFAKYFGLQFPMLLSSIPTFIALFFVLSLKEPSINKRNESSRYIKTMKTGFMYLVRHKTLRILTLDFIVITVATYFIIWLYQLAMKNLGVDIKYFGFIHALECLAQIFIIHNFIRFEQFLGSKRKALLVSSIIVGASLIICGISNNVFIVITAVIIGVGFGYGRYPSISNYMNKFIESGNRATVLSSVSMFNRFFQAAVNPFVGYLTDWSLNFTFIILGSIALIFSFFGGVKEEHLID